MKSIYDERFKRIRDHPKKNDLIIIGDRQLIVLRVYACQVLFHELPHAPPASVPLWKWGDWVDDLAETCLDSFGRWDRTKSNVPTPASGTFRTPIL